MKNGHLTEGWLAGFALLWLAVGIWMAIVLVERRVQPWIARRAADRPWVAFGLISLGFVAALLGWFIIAVGSSILSDAYGGRIGAAWVTVPGMLATAPFALGFIPGHPGQNRPQRQRLERSGASRATAHTIIWSGVLYAFILLGICIGAYLGTFAA